MPHDDIGKWLKKICIDDWTRTGWLCAWCRTSIWLSRHARTIPGTHPAAAATLSLKTTSSKSPIHMHAGPHFRSLPQRQLCTSLTPTQSQSTALPTFVSSELVWAHTMFPVIMIMFGGNRIKEATKQDQVVRTNKHKKTWY